MSEEKCAIETLDYSKSISIEAPIEIAWDAAIAEIGPEGEFENGKPMNFKLEAWPGGRWYRDLGNNSGHLWGHVQVIKPPKLLELCGPAFLSYPATNHIAYRFTAEGDRTTMKITHRAHGFLPPKMIEGVDEGWSHSLERIIKIAARMKKEKKS